MRDMMKKSLVLLSVMLWAATCGVNKSFASDVAVVVNANNPIMELSFRDLEKIFKLDKKYWENGNKIYFIMQEAENLPTKILLSKVYQMQNYHDLKTYWLGMIFREELSSFPQVLSSDEAIKRFIIQAPNAIGFINASSIDTRVKVLRIDGKLPGDAGYPLTDNPS